MKRQEITDNILKELKKIKIVNGFYSNIGNDVLEWYEKPLTKAPVIICRDISDDTVFESSLMHSLKIETDIIIAPEDNALWHLREATSDVLKVYGIIANDDALNYNIEYLGSEYSCEEKDKFYAIARLIFLVKYETLPWEQ